MGSQRRFNPHRRSSSPELNPLIERATAAVEEHLTPAASRRRKRRESSQRLLQTTVEAVLCDLLHATLTGEAGTDTKLVVSVSKNRQVRPKRYRAEVEGRNFGPILKALDETGWITVSSGLEKAYLPVQERAGAKSRCTSVAMGPALSAWLAENDVAFTDFRKEGVSEVVVLRGSERPYRATNELADYPDTPQTQRIRGTVQELNAWIAGFQLSYLGEGVDTTERTLKRIFNNGSFDEGGRLFGGFWQPMKKEKRSYLRFDEEHCVTLDYGQAFARLLYSHEGCQPPAGDQYALEGMPPKARNGVKRLFNALLFSATEPNRFPRGCRKDGIPKNYNVATVLRLLRQRHPHIAKHFPSRIGFRLFHRESEILIEVLQECRRQGIPALPIHDAILVPASKARAAQGIMEEVFLKETGVAGNVSSTLNKPSESPCLWLSNISLPHPLIRAT